jgi:integrase
LVQKSLWPTAIAWAERYRELLATHVLPALGGRRLQALNVSELDALYGRLEKRLSPATIRHVHVAIKAALSVAVDKGHLRANPAARASVPRAIEPDCGQALAADELRRLLDGFRGSALFSIIVTAAFTGARLGEVLALRWSDLDPIAKTLRIERAIETTREHGRRLKPPKSKRGERIIAIDDVLVAVLLAERDKHLRLAAGVPDGAQVDLSLVRLPADALMFPSPDGAFGFTRLRNTKSVTKETRARFRKLGFDRLRFHDLRASHGTALLDAGVPVHVVAARLGHDPAVLLRTYAKRTNQSDAAAAAVIGAIAKGVL